jgi:hypothetical protein
LLFRRFHAVKRFFYQFLVDQFSIYSKHGEHLSTPAQNATRFSGLSTVSIRGSILPLQR